MQRNTFFKTTLCAIFLKCTSLDLGIESRCRTLGTIGFGTTHLTLSRPWALNETISNPSSFNERNSQPLVGQVDNLYHLKGVFAKNERGYRLIMR